MSEEEKKLTKAEWDEINKKERADFASQTELERDLRFQLAAKDASVQQWQGYYQSVNQQNNALREQVDALREKGDVWKAQIEAMKITNETQGRLLDNYQKHIDLMLTVDNLRLQEVNMKRLPSGKEERNEV
jgi:hypothetical protein